jgi:hypothetical protein
LPELPAIETQTRSERAPPSMALAGIYLPRYIVHVPRIAEFEGVVVYIYFDEHVPPHFHAVYGEHEAVIDITTCALVEGSLPRAKLKRTIEWAREHQSLLTAKWAEITGM